ncbi:iron-hydroxamate transporter permease subunit [Serratia rubidaea]|uniref:Iron-hydroxamate transporter permease subunit n=1 Tax=Serratia rubidaea TaxID=61652 RepID=A0A4U9HQR7_SERRU|nr:iron-hydroxamate transporter permease subunit [Serratia rubidaea]
MQFILPAPAADGAAGRAADPSADLLGLDDGVARNLGLGLAFARFSALALAIVFSAMLVNAVGVIGFYRPCSRR